MEKKGETKWGDEKIFNSKVRAGRKIKSAGKRFVVGSSWRGTQHTGEQK